MWEALAGAGIDMLGTAATGLINSAIGRSNAKWTAALDWKYMKKAKELDWQYDSTNYFDLDKRYYQYQSEQQYNWARRYAENSSKWQVQGLRNANLNPILAATDGNFRGTFGEPVSMGSHGGHGGGSSGSVRSPKVDGSIGNLGSSMIEGAKGGAQVSNIEQNTQTLKTQSDLNSANTAKANADTNLMKAQQAKTLVETGNAAKNGGYTSFGSQLMNTAKQCLTDIFSEDGAIKKIDDAEHKEELRKKGEDLRKGVLLRNTKQGLKPVDSSSGSMRSDSEPHPTKPKTRIFYR